MISRILSHWTQFAAVLVALSLLAPPAHSEPGDLDTSFGTGGKVTTAIESRDDYGQSVVVQSDGKIIVAGYTYDPVTRPTNPDNFALVC